MSDKALSVDPAEPVDASVDGSRDMPWPWLLRWGPRQLLTVTGLFLALVWTTWIAIDVLDIGGWGDGLQTPMWRTLYNRGVIDVAEWVLLALAVVSAGYLAAHTTRRRDSSFFFLLGMGLGLILIEEASNIRRDLGVKAREMFGDTILGLDYSLVTEAPVLAAVAALPLYALVRYGKDIWRVRPARPYLVAGYATFGLAGATSVLKHVGEFYVTIGGAVDSLVGGRVPPVQGYSENGSHAAFVDATLEESIEIMACALMLAMILAFAQATRDAKG